MNASRRYIRPLVLAGLLALAGCGGGGGGASGSRSAPAGDEPSGDRARAGLHEEWFWAAPDGASAGMPAADAAGVALTAGRQRTVLLDPGGAPRWEAERVGVRDVAPLLTADLVVVPTDDGAVAYERAGGRLRWEATVGERVNSPVLAGDRAVATTWEGSLVAFDVRDGRVAWRTDLGGDALGPAASAGSVVVATFDTGRRAGMVAVDAASGRPRWTTPLPAGGVGAPAVVSGSGGGDWAPVAVAVAGDIAAHALSLDDGATRWRTPLEGAGSPELPPLPLPDGTVLVPHRQGGVALLGADDGSVRWRASSDGAAVRGGPAGPGPGGWFALPLDDGRLLLARADGGAELLQPPGGLVVGVASGPGGQLLIATAHGPENRLTAVSGW